MKKVKLLACVRSSGQALVTFLDGGRIRTARAGEGIPEKLSGIESGTEIFVSAAGDLITNLALSEPVNAPKKKKAPENGPVIPEKEKIPGKGSVPERTTRCRKNVSGIRRLKEAVDGCRAETACEMAMKKIACLSADKIAEHDDGTSTERAVAGLGLLTGTVDQSFAWRLTVMTAVLLWYAARSCRKERLYGTLDTGEHAFFLENANAALSMVMRMPYDPGMPVAVCELIKVVYAPATVETMNREASLFRSVIARLEVREEAEKNGRTDVLKEH